MLRNWAAMHVVLILFVLMQLLLFHAVRYSLIPQAATWFQADGARFVAGWYWLGVFVWWSPYLWIPLAVLVLAVIPTGWAYWLVQGDRDTWLQRHSPWMAVLLITALSGTVGFELTKSSPWLPPEIRQWPWPGALKAISLVSAFTVAWFLLVYILPSVWNAVRRWWSDGAGSTHDSERRKEGGWDEERREERIKEQRRAMVSRARIRLGSLFLSSILLAIAAALFALIDSFGQTLYWHSRTATVAWLGGVAAALAGGATVGRNVYVLLQSTLGKKRLRPSLGLIVNVGACLLVTVVLASLSAVSHGVVWGWKELPNDPPAIIAATLAGEPARWEAVDQSFDESDVTGSTTDEHLVTGLPTGRWLWLWFGATALLSLSFGRLWPFLNQSSQQPLYNSRLTRAYLGASNPLRWRGGGNSVLQALEGDGISREGYKPHEHGGPIHLVNVTVNETMDGKSQTQQQDRKGFGMAIGPDGVSVGVRHHATWCNGGRELLPPFYREDVFQVFEDHNRAPVVNGQRQTKACETLDLGGWVGVSGAAFSTGLGARTSPGLSLLCGMFAVRLGHWWDSGTTPWRRRPRVKCTLPRKLAYAINAVFPVQMYLLDEFTARFHGTARARWYLSDGGHFENMGAYELIRRRLPFIVVVDGEQDQGYTFEGLANLVRKARLDFQTEIEFLTPGEFEERKLKELLGSSFGWLEQLRPGRAPDASDAEHASSRTKGAASREFSSAHAAVARIWYPDAAGNSGVDRPSRQPGWLVYVKATLTGDEPLDLLQYGSEHPAFPHETTADQWFDEAQWESYRKLGEHIGSSVFPADGGHRGDRLWPLGLMQQLSDGGTTKENARDSARPAL